MTSMSEGGYAKAVNQISADILVIERAGSSWGFLFTWQRTDLATAAFAANDGPISTYSKWIATFAPAPAEISAWACGSFAGAPDAGTANEPHGCACFVSDLRSIQPVSSEPGPVGRERTDGEPLPGVRNALQPVCQYRHSAALCRQADRMVSRTARLAGTD